MKIVYCLNSIKGLGGIQISTITKANALAKIESNQVYIVVTDHKEEHTQFAELSPNVKFVHLDVNYYDDDYLGGIRVKINQIKKRRKHKKILNEFLNSLEADIVISVGQSEKYLLSKTKFKKNSYKFIREFHFDTNFRLSLAQTRLGRLFARIKNIIDYNILVILHYDIVVVLTPQDLNDNWRGKKNVYQIPNPITQNLNILNKKNSNSNIKTIVSLGRLSFQKNYFFLIEVFSKIAHKFPDWQLHIYGDGEDKNELEKLINIENLKNQIKIFPSSLSVGEILLSSNIFVMSSRMEGLPLVMIEAMAAGLPIVANDFKYGPRYLISDGVNGYIAPFDDKIIFAEKLEHLMKNENLRKIMGCESLKRSKDFSPDVIAEQWMQLFKKIKSVT